MKHLFKPEVFKGLIALLVLLLMVKSLWFVVEVVWLPSSGLEHAEEKGGKALYYRVKLTPNEAPAPERPKPTRPAKPQGSIKDIELLAIYNASDVTVITVSYKKKTKVLSKGDEINGFVLEGAGSNFATFSKNSKTYQINLIKSKKGDKSVSKAKDVAAATSSETQSSSSKVEGDIIDAGDHRIIDKSLVEHYAKNMEEIMKNIGIAEQKEGKDLKGFRVTFVRKNSHFSKLGLRRGDVIKSINGQEITSYNAAMNVYKNIDTMDSLSLTIIRGKEEMELEYEIN
ncbi:MAG: PDZ domain-containing protein [Sulfurovum sp.]|nr:MAG: PDZ domain-containing protein [Sulfurovum sp.]